MKNQRAQEDSLIAALREINRNLTHSKTNQELTATDKEYYVNLTASLEALSDYYLAHAQELSELKNEAGDILIKSSMFLNAALAIKIKRELFQEQDKALEIKRITDKINEIEHYFVTGILGVESNSQTEWETEQDKLGQVTYKNSLLELRDETKERLEVIRSDQELNQENYTHQRAEAIHEVSSEIVTPKLKEFLTQQFAECLEICGTPPCSYSVSLLGSIAKKTATPYSDIEFAILTDEEGKNQAEINHNKEYFRNLSRLLCLRINNLGESAIPQSWIYGIDLNNAYTMGISFDLGGKTPLNRKRTQEDADQSSYPLGSDKYDLIATPTEMMRYFNEKYFHIDKFLSFEINNMDHLLSGTSNHQKATEKKSAFDTYQEQLIQFHAQEDPKTQRPNHEARSIKMMYEGGEDSAGKTIKSDLDKYDPNLLGGKKEGALYQIKQDIYRLPDRLIEGLAQFYNIETGGKDSWELLEELAQINSLSTSKSSSIINPQAKEQLQIMLSIAVELRLNFDLFHQGQLGMVSVMDDLMEEKVGHEGEARIEMTNQATTTSTFSKQQIQLLERFYYTALPFHEKVNKFYASQSNIDTGKSGVEEKSGDIHSFFSQESFFDDSGLAKAQISTRFLRHQETINNYLKAIEELEEKFGRNHPNVAASLNNLGNAYGSLGDHKQQIKYYEESLKIRESLFGRNHPVVAMSLNNLGNAYGSLGDHKQQIKYLEESLAINNAIFGRNHPDVAASLNNLGNAYGSLGDHNQEIQYFEESLKIRESLFGRNHPVVAMTLNNLGNAYGSLGDHKQEIKYLEESLKIREAIFGRNHPDVAASLNNLGSAYGSLGDHKQQIKYLEESLAINDAIFNRNHPNVAASLNNLGNAYGSLGGHKQQIKYYEESLAINDAIFGGNHPDVAMSLNNLGNAYGSLGDHKQQIKYYEESLAINDAIFGRNHPDVAASLNNLGNAYGSLGDHKQEIKNLEESLKIREAIFGRSHPEVAASLNNLGSAYGSLGDYKQQIKYLEESLVIRETLFGRNHPDVAASLNNLGNAYGSLEDHKQKIKYCEESLAINDAIFGRNHPDVAASLNNLGNAYGSLGDHKQEIKYLEESLVINDTIFDRNHPVVAASLNNLGRAYVFLKDYPKAFKLIQEALEISLEFYDQNHPNVQARIKLYLLLEREIQKSFICHNQGCKDHIDAIIEAKDGNSEESTRLIGLAQNNFEEALRLGCSSATYVEYANFLIQRKDVIGEDQEKIMFLLKKAIELKDDKSGLAYDKEGKKMLTEELQEILEEEIRQGNDESVMIEVRPVYLAYFLFIKMSLGQGLGQENEDETRGDNREVITNLLVQFREELEQDSMKGDVEESAIEIGNKLYNNVRYLMQDQESEEELDEAEDLRRTIALSIELSAESRSKIPSTSTSPNNVERVSQIDNINQK